MKTIVNELEDEPRSEYDLATLLKTGVRGKYVGKIDHAANIVCLEPDVFKAFPNSEAVNEALRLVMKLATITG